MFEHNAFLAEDVEHEFTPADAAQQVHSKPDWRAPSEGFQFPVRVWGAMLGCYAVFFLAIFAATGSSGHAKFAIIVSVLYTAMYFGLAKVGASQAGREDPSPLDRGKPLQTWTGPMSSGSVYSQVLIVPVVLAGFGIGVASIIAFVM